MITLQPGIVYEDKEGLRMYCIAKFNRGRKIAHNCLCIELYTSGAMDCNFFTESGLFGTTSSNYDLVKVSDDQTKPSFEI